MTEMLAVVLNGTQTAQKFIDPQDNDATLVVGSGPVALMTCMVEKILRPNQPIVMAARSEEDGAFARSVLLSETTVPLIDQFTQLSTAKDNDGAFAQNVAIFERLRDEFQFAVAFESTGNNMVLEALQAGFPCRGFGGTVSYGIYPKSAINTRPRRLVQGWDTLIRRSVRLFPATLRLLEANGSDFEKLLGHSIPFEHLDEVFIPGGIDLSGATKIGAGPKLVIEHTH